MQRIQHETRPIEIQSTGRLENMADAQEFPYFALSFDLMLAIPLCYMY